MKLLIEKEHYQSWRSLKMTKKYSFLIGIIMKIYYKKKGYEVSKVEW